MYKREFQLDHKMPQSMFLFGPRGTGKTSWAKTQFPDSLYLDLLDTQLFIQLKSSPWKLESLIDASPSEWVIIDEIQKVPDLLNEVHRLIESKKQRFILTGSSARALRKRGVNLLAGRALIYNMHPLTMRELGDDFDLDHSLRYGQLPAVYVYPKPGAYLKSYIEAYIRQEVMQEGLTRRLDSFLMMLETVSFSQGSVLNYSEIGREIGASNKLVESYFQILEDLLIGTRLPVFTKRSKRRMITHPKFYFFDVGIYKTLRPKGPVDTHSELNGAGLETLFLQELRAVNDYYALYYSIYYWRTHHKSEVDFVLYGERGFCAFEVKHSQKISPNDLKGLKAFGQDYPEAQLYILFNGQRKEKHGNILAIPFTQALKDLPTLLT